MKTMHKNGHAPHNGSRHGAVDEVKGQFSGLAKEARNIEGAAINEAKKRGAELLENAQQKGRKAWTGTEKLIKKNPGAAVGIAFAAGVLLKSWLTKREE